MVGQSCCVCVCVGGGGVHVWLFFLGGGEEFLVGGCWCSTCVWGSIHPIGEALMLARGWTRAIILGLTGGGGGGGSFAMGAEQ